MPGYVYSPPQYATEAEWDMGIVLQAVDGQEVPKILKDLAEQNIQGRPDFKAAARPLEKRRREYAWETAVADMVSSHIAEIMASDGFSFRPAALEAIHRKLFAGISDFAGETRDVDISKPEPVHNGRSVSCARRDEIRFNLQSDFRREADEPYAKGDPSTLDRLCSFARAVWQTHPFLEGSTRTTAVFLSTYLQSKGFKVDSGLFNKENFLDVREDPSFLKKCFGNLLFGALLICTRGLRA